jgi:hypothetical protein
MYRKRKEIRKKRHLAAFVFVPSHKIKKRKKGKRKVVIKNLANFLSIFQTKPSFCHLFAVSQLAFPATVLISAVS